MSHDTEPRPTADDGELPEMPIHSGHAAVHVAGAFLNVMAAMARLEAVCAAVARQLDATTATRREAP